jgi:2-amino-4-hydroxy-6-hydroxymethyldihydropteridine diphosphokinase
VEQDWFLNCCALVGTTLDPEQLLATVLAIESQFKRERTVRWGPRTIDIDILTYGDLEMETDGLTIPHPRMLDRAFVLLPLADIAGDLVIKGRTVSDWASACDATGVELASNDGNWWRGGKA